VVILLVTGFLNITGAADYTFGELKKGEKAPEFVATLNINEFVKHEIFRAIALTAISNQMDYEALEKINDKLRLRYRIKTGLIVSGGIFQIAGLGMYLSDIKELKPWGAGLMVFGVAQIGIGVAF